MGKRTSSIDRRPARRGYTLVEAMLASVLLSVSVVAISGAIGSSYSQEEYAQQRRAALESGMQLLDEVSALPMDPASASNPSIMGYSSYTDEAPIDQLTSVVTAAAAPVTSTTKQNAKRAVVVDRKTSLSGATSATGDFAVVAVEVDNGRQKVRIKRLVTTAEANATH